MSAPRFDLPRYLLSPCPRGGYWIVDMHTEGHPRVTDTPTNKTTAVRVQKALLAEVTA